MVRMYRIGKASEKLGVTPQTVRAWCKQGKIKHHSSPTGQLMFTDDDLSDYIGGDNESNTDDDNREWAYYARSSAGSQVAINNQFDLLSNKYPEAKYRVSDKASGLNENRKGLWRLIRLASEHEYTDLAITARDRLTRFGYKYLEAYLNTLGVTLHVINTPAGRTAREELMDDFMALIASFSGRYYSQRSPKNMRELINNASERLDDNNSTGEDNHE